MRKFAALVAFMTCVYSYRSWYRGSSSSFWKLVQRHADVAFEYFRNDSAWQVFIDDLPHNLDEIVPRNIWMGPYQLTVPKLRSKQVFVFYHATRYKRSQSELALALAGLH
ncbi:MAG TPA: hypothetical protein VND43_00645 [Burkholderiales bacterium]|nr:hypothetical protein [Burkholderiales bacterium]